MTGPEHYQEAERILSNLHEIEASSDAELPAEIGLALAKAQVHATLASAAATALNDHTHDGEGGMPVDDWKAWKEVAAAPKADAKSAGES